MKEIRKGDIVARKSYKKDIIFKVEKVMKINKKKIAKLSGLIERIEADSDINDLEKVEKHIIDKNIQKTNKKLENRIREKKINEYEIGIVTPKNSRIKQNIITGKILHLDGDCKNVY